MRISVIMPTLRPDLAAQRISEFAVTQGNTDYEIVVVAPKKIEGPNVLWVEEKECHGGIAANNLGVLHSTGDIIVWWSDDAIPAFNCLKEIADFLVQKTEPFAGAFRLFGNGELPQWGVYGKLYPCWGGMTRKTLNLLGMMFSSEYKGFWADPDLGLRIWSLGGSVEVCPGARLSIAQQFDSVKSQNWNKYFNQDWLTFHKKWDSIFSDGKDKDWHSINRECPVSFGD